MKKFFTIIILLFIAGVLPAQNYMLRGKIADSKTREPIQNAVVFISYNHMTYTDSDGKFQLPELKEGEYTLKISQVGYKSISESIYINENVAKDFLLILSPIELDEVMISANRFDKYLKNSPYSELLVNREQIEQKLYLSLSDALKTEPGVSSINEGAWGTEASLRGMSRENVVALIDGNRIATSTDVSARFSLVDLNDIERVEVIKGASSSMYGSGATGGIINIVTKAPRYSDSFSITGGVSSGYNSVNGASVNSGMFSGGNSIWSIKISGAHRKAHNLKTPIGEIKNSQFEDYSFSGILSLNTFENQSLKLNYQLFKAENVGIPGSMVFPSIADVRYVEARREMISAGYEIKNIFPFLYKLSVNYSNQFISRDVENIPYVVQNIPATGTLPARRVSVLKITPGADHRNNNLQMHGSFLLAENNNLVVGVDYWDRRYNGNRERHQLIEAFNSSGEVISVTNKIIGEKPLPESKFMSFGVFAQNDIEFIKDEFSVSLGARIDKITVKGAETPNPAYEIVNGAINYAPAGQKIIWYKNYDRDYSYSSNIGSKYSIYSNLDITLSLGYSFRSPSLEERFQYIDQGGFVKIGDPTLNPELGKSIDLGVRYYSYELKFVSSVFFNYFSDLVVEKPGEFEGRPAFIKTNVGEARLYGFDLRTDYNFYKNYVLYFIASYVKGDDITANSDLPSMPPLNGALGLKFDFMERADLDINATLFARQRDIAPGETQTPGYAIFNASVISKRINYSAFGFRIAGGVENILNKNHRNHLSTTRGNIAIEPGRNVFGKIIINW